VFVAGDQGVPTGSYAFLVQGHEGRKPGDLNYTNKHGHIVNDDFVSRGVLIS
jgi:hypothetical protein